MLILSRRTFESLVLEMPDGTKAKIVVAEIRGGSVRLGIDAPKEIVVVREELHLKPKPQGV